MSAETLTANKVLLTRARASLKGKWVKATGLAVLLSLMFALPQYAGWTGIIVSLLLWGPFMLGISGMSLNVARDQDVGPGDLFAGFTHGGRFGRALGAYLLIGLILLLWCLIPVAVAMATLVFGLFSAILYPFSLIPFVVALLSYALTFYVLSDHPGAGPLEAIRRSKGLMRGRRWKLLRLILRFVVWSLLILLAVFLLVEVLFPGTLSDPVGIVFMASIVPVVIWGLLGPYLYVSLAHFYEDVRVRGGGEEEASADVAASGPLEAAA